MLPIPRCGGNAIKNLLDPLYVCVFSKFDNSQCLCTIVDRLIVHLRAYPVCS